MTNDTFSSPFFIFIKVELDQIHNVFKKLELDKWNLLEDINCDKVIEESSNRHFYTIWTDGWLHIMDDWYYTLWYDEQLKINLLELSKDIEIFSCSVGETDESFDFRLFQNGKIIREYVVEDPKFNRGDVVKNCGKPLKREEEALQKNDIVQKVISVAKNHGISMNYASHQIKAYYRQELDIEKFEFNENEY